MALTTLDPNTALIVVDLQKGIVGLPVAHPVESVIANAVSLADAFRAHALPVVLVNVAGGAPGRTEQPRRMRDIPEGWTELIPALKQQTSDLLITKHTTGAFAHTGLEDQLRALGVTQVVVVGIATSSGVESTARQAYEAGFNVTFAIDAMTDSRPDSHDYSVANIFPRLGESGTTQALLQMLIDTRA